jgi:hypothetical protein
MGRGTQWCPSVINSDKSDSDVRQIEVHTAEPLVSGPNYLEIEIPIAKMKNYKSKCSDQILAELI